MEKDRRVTLNDVATAAGVGVATVDRVLNGRVPVAPGTAARVLEAAETLGYHGKPLLRMRIAEQAPACRLGFLLQKQGKWVYQALAEELRAACASRIDVRAEPVFSFVDSLSPDALAAEIVRLGGLTDALAVVSVDDPAVSAAIAECTGRGLAVYALLSPLSTSDIAGFAGIDGLAAGRTAGWAMARMQAPAGEVGVLLGSQRYLGQQSNERGFRAALADHAPSRLVRETILYLDDEAMAYEAAQELLHAAPDMTGLYHSGGGVSGVVRAVEESGRAEAVTYICHARTPESEAALRRGTADMVLSVPYTELARQLTGCMAQAVRRGQPGPPPDPCRFEILTTENL